MWSIQTTRVFALETTGGAEPAEGVAPRAARIHHGRYARVNAREVGIDGGLVDAVIDVGMQVYEARDDQLAIKVDYPGVGSGSDVGRDLDMTPSWVATSILASMPCDGSITLPLLSRRLVTLMHLRYADGTACSHGEMVHQRPDGRQQGRV